MARGVPFQDNGAPPNTRPSRDVQRSHGRQAPGRAHGAEPTARQAGAGAARAPAVRV